MEIYCRWILLPSCYYSVCMPNRFKLTLKDSLRSVNMHYETKFGQLSTVTVLCLLFSSCASCLCIRRMLICSQAFVDSEILITLLSKKSQNVSRKQLFKNTAIDLRIFSAVSQLDWTFLFPRSCSSCRIRIVCQKCFLKYLNQQIN